MFQNYIMYIFKKNNLVPFPQIERRIKKVMDIILCNIYTQVAHAHNTTLSYISVCKDKTSLLLHYARLF